MADELEAHLTSEQETRALNLLRDIMPKLRHNEAIDFGFPSMSFEDAVLCTRYLTGLPEPQAAQLVAAQRGEDFDDLSTVVD